MSERDATRNMDYLRAVGHRVRGARPAPRPSWPSGLAEAYAARGTPETVNGPEHVATGIEVTVWRLLHKTIHHHPFHPDPALPRGDQWRRMRGHVDDILGDPEILAWVAEQAEICDNRDRGHHDWRPRKDGPRFDLLLEYVGNSKRTALAIHHFALADREDD